MAETDTPNIKIIKRIVDEQLATVTAQNLILAQQGKQNPCSLGVQSADRKKVQTPDGQVYDAINVGNPTGINATVRVNSTQALVINDRTRVIRREDLGDSYVLLRGGSDFYIGVFGDDPMTIYKIDLAAALGHPVGFNNVRMTFSRNGRHLFITEDPDNGQSFTPGELLRWSWLKDWVLVVQSGNKVVSWASAERHSITIPSGPAPPPVPPNPTPVHTIPQIPPGVPNPYKPAGNAHYVLQWEPETDPNVNLQIPIYDNFTRASFENYDDQNGDPHTVWYGRREVTRTTPTAFRPRYCYNANFEGFETERLAEETDPDCPPYCSRITYGPVEIFGLVWRRKITFLAGFIEDVNQYLVCPHVTLPKKPVWYIGYITNSVIAPPSGHDPLGPGNCQGSQVEINAHSICDADDVANPISVYWPHFQNASLLAPAASKDGSFTNWTQWQFPYAASYVPTVPPPLILDGCSPAPPDPPIYVQPPYLASIPNIFAVPFQWGNVVYKNYLWSCTDNITLSFLETNTIQAPASEQSPVVDPQGADLDVWLQPTGNHQIKSGTDWQFSAGSESAYKYVDPNGTMHTTSVKTNMDVATIYTGKLLGPFEWYTSDANFLRTGAGDKTIPAEPPVDGPHRAPTWITNEMMVKDYFWVNTFPPPVPIPPVPPSVPPFVIEDPPDIWVNEPLGFAETRITGPQAFESIHVINDYGQSAFSVSVQKSTWDDTHAVLELGDKMIAPQWDQGLNLSVLDWCMKT